MLCHDELRRALISTELIRCSHPALECMCTVPSMFLPAHELCAAHMPCAALYSWTCMGHMHAAVTTAGAAGCAVAVGPHAAAATAAG